VVQVPVPPRAPSGAAYLVEAEHLHGVGLGVQHRGRIRVLVAVGHSILIALWHMLTNNVNYQDLGPDYFLTRLDRTRTTRRLLDQLQRLGYQAQLNPRAKGSVSYC
jgi:hypothetical protein